MPRGIPNAPKQAKNTPVTAPARETHTADLAIGQPPEVNLANAGSKDRGEVIVPVDKPLDKDYMEALAFAEEAITIRIERGSEEFAPLVVDCWVNGEGAEVMDPVTKKWVKLSCLPIGGVIITKRKFVEVLARSKVDRVRTVEENSRPQENEDGWKLRRTTSSKSVFSVINDPNPKGAEWLTRLMAER